MANERDVISRIYLLLASNAAQKIDFEFDRVHFVGSNLIQVMASLNVTLWGYTGIGIEFGTVADGAAAQYSPSKNVYKLTNANFGLTPEERMDLVHESIHAWLDIRMPKVRSIGTAAMKGMLTTTKATDEAVAYLGGILFYIYDNTPSGSKPTIPADWNNSIFIEAWRIAVSIMSRPGAVVSAKDVASLKKIIMDDPNYSDIKDDPTSNYGNDGV